MTTVGVRRVNHRPTISVVPASSDLGFTIAYIIFIFFLDFSV